MERKIKDLFVKFMYNRRKGFLGNVGYKIIFIDGDYVYNVKLMQLDKKYLNTK